MAITRDIRTEVLGCSHDLFRAILSPPYGILAGRILSVSRSSASQSVVDEPTEPMRPTVDRAILQFVRSAP